MTHAYEMPVRASTKGDQHWQRWIAKGEARDRDVENRVRVVGLAIASSVAIWFAATWSLR